VRRFVKDWIEIRTLFLASFQPKVVAKTAEGGAPGATVSSKAAKSKGSKKAK
jgi:hypothetical protein